MYRSLLFLIVVGLFQPAFSAQNAAQGQSYELLTRRNYRRGSAEDLRILTDGETTNGYWTRANTLAWRVNNAARVEVILDLERLRPISGVALWAVHGVAAHPPRTEVWVSDDLKTFRRACEWDPGAKLEVAPDGLETDRYPSPKLRTAGRWVLLVMDQPRERIGGEWRRGLICLTEIEVEAGDFDPAVARPTGEELDLREHLRSSDPFRHIPPVDDAFETPHVKWAPKLAGGRPVVMSLVSYVCARDVVELGQRMGMEHRIFSLLRQDSRMDLLRHEELLEAVTEPLDALLLAGTDWTILRDPARRRILQLVRDGMGLVWVHPRGEDENLASLLGALPERWFPVLDASMAEMPYPLLDELRAGTLGELRCGLLGKGRVAVWRYANPDGARFVQMNSALWPQCAPGSNEPEDFAWWEFYAAELCQIVRWAAHGEPAARLGRIEAEGPIRDSVIVTVPILGDAAGLRVRARLLDECNRTVAEVAAPAGPDGTRLAFGGPLQTGPHAAVLWLEDKRGRQVDWRAAMVDVDGPRITAIKTDRERYEVGDTVWLAVSCQGADGLRLMAELVDFYDGVVDRAETDAAAEVALSLETGRSSSLVCEARVRLMSGEVVVDQDMALVPTISEPDLDEYAVGLWSSYGSYIGKRHWGYDMLRSQLPLDVDFAIAGPIPGYPRFDMRPCAESMHRIFFKGADRYVNMNLAEPGFREAFLQTILPKIRSARNWGAYDFSVGDECGYNLKTDEHTMAALREWLRDRYVELAALNREWNAAFGSWDEVVLEFEPDDESVTSHAPGLDHRLFSDWLFNDTITAARRAAEEIDPRNRLGISGTRDPTHYAGFDYWRLMGATSHLAFYDGLQREAIRSFRRPGSLITSFIGYDYADVNERLARYFPWLELLNGFQGVSIYSASSGDLGGFVRPDLTLTRRARWLIEETEELKGGIGKALLTAEPSRPPIAVHHSQRSLHLGRMLDTPTIANLTSVCEIIEDLGYQFDFVSHEQIVDGTFAGRGYPVLMLPHSLAMSRAEVDAVAEWTRSGGTLIVIGAVGLANEHGRVLDDPPMDELLGVRGEIHPRPLDPEAKQPAAVTIGGGRAVVLDALLHEYREFQPTGVAGETIERVSGNEEACAAYRALMDRLLVSAGAASFAKVSDPDGSARPYIETVQFERGQIRYLGIIEKYFGGRYSRGSDPLSLTEGDLEQVFVKPAAGGHIYDLRATPIPADGQEARPHPSDPVASYLGTGLVQTRLAPSVARVYAIVPYQVTGLTVEAPKRVFAGDVFQATCRVQVDAGKCGDHVVHVELADPSGKVIKPYARNVLTRAGEGHTDFSLPLSAAPGEWTVRVRDVISGLTAEAKVMCGGR